MKHMRTKKQKCNKSYPISNALYKRIREEKIQIEYKDTGKRADYCLIAGAEEKATIYIPEQCLQIQSLLEIQWDIAHELGHYLNWKDGHEPDNVLEKERLAWDKGEEILKECEIPLYAPDGEWVIAKTFHEEVGRCLGTYQVSKIMVDGKISEKIKYIIKEMLAFVVNGLTIYYATIGVLGMAISSEERTLLFNANILNSLFWSVLGLYICSFIIKKWLMFNRNKS